MPLRPSEIDDVCRLTEELCGIHLDASKSYLIESRLEDLVRRTGSPDYVDFVDRVRADTQRRLQNRFVDAITTNETQFFRDRSPFEALKHKVLPELIDSRSNDPVPCRIRIWSAACSTGQEAYSIAMALYELLPDINNWDLRILATDISDAAIGRASRGWYSQHDVQRGLTPARLERFFHRSQGGWQVTDELRSMIVFERQNLLDFHFQSAALDVIFCRNIAIYFKPAARRQLFERIASSPTPQGYLLVGSQETLFDLGPRFAPHHHCRATLYRPNLSQILPLAGRSQSNRPLQPE